MSAAEKLKERAAALADRDRWFPDGIAAQQDVLAALPQIAAVVEAAQSVTSADQGAWHGSRLLLSLVALDEALSPKMIYTDASGDPFDPQPIREALS